MGEHFRPMTPEEETLFTTKVVEIATSQRCVICWQLFVVDDDVRGITGSSKTHMHRCCWLVSEGVCLHLGGDKSIAKKVVTGKGHIYQHFDTKQR
jgi:hypothetical protein